VSEQHETTESNVMSLKSLITQHRNRNRSCAQCSSKILNLDVIFAKETTTATATAAAAATGAAGGAEAAGAAAAAAPAGSNGASAATLDPTVANGVGAAASGIAPSEPRSS